MNLPRGRERLEAGGNRQRTSRGVYCSHRARPSTNRPGSLLSGHTAGIRLLVQDQKDRSTSMAIATTGTQSMNA